MTDMLDAAQSTDKYAKMRAALDDALVEDPETGRYQVRRSVFTDEQLFDLEMTHIFEGNWIYLAHESQIPKLATTSPPTWAVSPSSSPETRMANSAH